MTNFCDQICQICRISGSSPYVTNSNCRSVLVSERFISYRKYILQITQPSQYRCMQLKYIFAVISKAPSRLPNHSIIFLIHNISSYSKFDQRLNYRCFKEDPEWIRNLGNPVVGSRYLWSSCTPHLPWGSPSSGPWTPLTFSSDLQAR